MLHRSQVLAGGWLSFLAGVAHFPQLLIYGCICIIIATQRGWRRWLLLPGWLVCSFYGTWCYDTFMPITPYEDGGQIELIAVVERLPILKNNLQRLVVRPESEVNSAIGLLQLDLPIYPSYQYGDRLVVECTVRLPAAFDGFAYDRYLARYHIVALCDDPIVTDLQSFAGSPQLRQIYQLRQWLKQQVEWLWPEPAASLILGVLIGEQDTISEEIYTAFQQAGVVHILVVSGMHVLIIVQLLTKVTRWLPRFWQVVVIICLLTGFCALTGFSATVIRATVMGCIPLLGRLFFRPSQIALALIWAAGIISVINPFILVHDIGFQLSFLATIGLVYVSPLLERPLRWLPEWFGIRETISTSVAATITTAPWIGLMFGTWSNVALLANVVVIPISNLMLFGGAMITLVSALVPQLAQGLAVLLGSAVQFMVWWVDALIALPHAYLSTLTVSFSWVVIYYALFTLVLWLKQ